MGRRSQAGVAVIMAMLVVSLVAVIVSNLFWRTQVAIRSVENRLAMTQARWVERAAMDWARVILQVDLRAGSVDHLGEPWAVPVMDTRIDETVAAGAQLDERSGSAVLAGQIMDAQSRLNLTGLISDQGDPSPRHQAALRRLLRGLGRPESLADVISHRVAQSRPRRVNGQTQAAARPPLTRVTDLLDEPAIEPAVLTALIPHLIVLPRPTPINLNTASAEVVSAWVPELDGVAARQWVARRERGFFRSLSEAALAMSGAPTLDPSGLAVDSSFFLVAGVIRLGRVEYQSETLLERSIDRVGVVWQVRR